MKICLNNKDIQELNDNSSILLSEKQFLLLYSISKIKTNNENYIIAEDRKGNICIIKKENVNNKVYYRDLLII